MIRCTTHPHLQSWSMMQHWGVTKRPTWQSGYIARINTTLHNHYGSTGMNLRTDDCPHASATGVDHDWSERKVWRCDVCGWQYRNVPVGDGSVRLEAA